MSLELDAGGVKVGIESESAMVLSALLWITDPAVFTPPVLPDDIRTKIQAGQPVGYMTDAGFDQYLTRIFALPLVDSSLDTAERTILNNIREVLDPPPTAACCGLGGGVDPTLGNSSIQINPRTGTASFESELVIKTANTVRCDIKEIIVTIAPVGGEPVADVSPVTCNLFGCVEGSTKWSKLWIDFVGDPTGGDYTFSADFKDTSGASIVVLVFPFSFP